MGRGIAAGILTGLLVASTAAAQGESTWYARKLTLGETPLRVEHFWSKGRRLRAHTTLAGHPIVTIVSGDRYYVLDELTLGGIAIRRSPGSRKLDQNGGRPFGNDVQRILADGGEKVGTERLAGAICDVYRVTDSRGRREVWVTQDEPKVPIRVVVFDRASGRSGRNDYLDWSQSVDVPDSFFEPDPRFQIERLEYEEYLERAADGPVGPAPVLYSDLLHGK